MLTTATNHDLLIACDRSESVATRAAAWDRYEVAQWLRAYKERGLLIGSMDNSTRGGPGGESMQLRVTRALKMPEVNSASLI